MTTFPTDQEGFWAGAFGSEYCQRNPLTVNFAGRCAMLKKILAKTDTISSLIEFGANIGNNLKALSGLLPEVDLAAVEINKDAAVELEKMEGLTVYQQSILEFESSQSFDMSFICGVLIHIAPDMLPRVYDALYSHTNRYIALAEYYNPTPVEIPYRGHSGKLFKRDFAGEILDRFPDLRLVDYGFMYHRDATPLDDLNWFLLEKEQGTA